MHDSPMVQLSSDDCNNILGLDETVIRINTCRHSISLGCLPFVVDEAMTIVTLALYEVEKTDFAL